MSSCTTGEGASIAPGSPREGSLTNGCSTWRSTLRSSLESSSIERRNRPALRRRPFGICAARAVGSAFRLVAGGSPLAGTGVPSARGSEGVMVVLTSIVDVASCSVPPPCWPDETSSCLRAKVGETGRAWFGLPGTRSPVVAEEGGSCVLTSRRGSARPGVCVPPELWPRAARSGDMVASTSATPLTRSFCVNSGGLPRRTRSCGSDAASVGERREETLGCASIAFGSGISGAVCRAPA